MQSRTERSTSRPRQGRRARKDAFDREVTPSTVMVDAIEAWLDTREG
jgi:hypothetical protein